MEHLDVSILNTAPDIRDCLGMSDAVGDVNTVQQSAPTFNFKDHVDGIVSQVDEVFFSFLPRTIFCVLGFNNW